MPGRREDFADGSSRRHRYHEDQRAGSSRQQQAGLGSDLAAAWLLLMLMVIQAAGRGDAELQPSSVHREFICSPRESWVVF